MSTDVVTLGKHLRPGLYCGYFEVVGEPGVVAKAAYPTRTKRYFPGFRVAYSLPWYTRWKYGIRDIVAHDYESLVSLPSPWRDHLPAELCLRRTTTGASAMCWREPVDFDGARSQTFLKTGPVSCPSFWAEMEALITACRRRSVWPMGLFPGSQQVTVQRLSPDRSRPVITADLIKLGRRMYPFQVYLWLPPILRWKFERRYRAFKKKFCASPAVT